ncbi:hypothetical protein SPRG_20667 [Saprolegnia parasitica CBS 223.65]|uniref:Ricin B lectin domain-containing protein n=1 Tax=Saprolegnia parasitica (strain CBS 223.65) TaxID=695850 RepID=A0A067C4V0_SAPPC|nr:hypothetical protein SPRG_20667 [Saprolegnia parasitica CBS 223.65]KDO25548.1 hypothetical protein SPRG_20667 [Saprolegnia parasitica CBS 223.65]|eukprot:XP_012203771.1 hypothetical protein SPRG_20667 [Saprolegnia parasitica CBS 223.65]
MLLRYVVGVLLGLTGIVDAANYRIYTSTNRVLAESNGNIVVATPSATNAINEIFDYTEGSGKLMAQSTSKCLGGQLEPMVLQDAAYNVHMKLRLGLWFCIGDSVNLPWQYDASSRQFKHEYYNGWCLDAVTSPISIYLCDASSATQRFRLVAAQTPPPTPRPKRPTPRTLRILDHRRRLESDNPPGFRLADPSEKLLPMRITLQSKGVLQLVGTELYVLETPRNGTDEWFEYNANQQTLRSLAPEMNSTCLTLHPSNRLYFSTCCAPEMCQSQQFVFYKNRLRHPTSFCVARNLYKPDAGRPMAGIWCNDDRDNDQWLAVLKEDAHDNSTRRRLDAFDTRIRAASGKLISEWTTGLYVNWAVNNKNEWFTYNEGGHTFQAQSNRQCIDAFWSSDPSVKWWVLKIHTYDCGYGNPNQEWSAEFNHIKHLNHAGMCMEARNDGTLGVNSCKFGFTPGEWLELYR